MEQRTGQVERTDVAHAVGAGFAVAALCAFTACRTFYTGDSPEFAAAAVTFGVPHPPGYPLYTLLAGVAARAAPVLEPAHAVNLVSAGGAGLAATFLFLFSRGLGVSRGAAWTAVATLAVGRTFWSSAGEE